MKMLDKLKTGIKKNFGNPVTNAKAIRSIYKSNQSIKKSNEDYNIIKADTEGPVGEPKDYTNPKFQARASANQVRFSRGAKGKSY